MIKYFNYQKENSRMKKSILFTLICFISMNCTNINQFIDVDDMLTGKQVLLNNN